MHAQVHRFLLRRAVCTRPLLGRGWLDICSYGVPHVLQSPVKTRWVASGLFGTSRLYKTTSGQRVVGLSLIWDDPCVPSPVDRRWLVSGSVGTSRLYMTTTGQRVVDLLLLRGEPCVQIPVERWWLASDSFGTSRLSKTTAWAEGS
jgi:hypothetical protein